jgi:hypothetical protein
MSRRHSILLLLLLASCSTPRPGPPAFPETAAGAWRLTSSQGFPAATAPDMVRNIGTRGWWSASYEGPGSATVEVYELTSSAGGLEMVQKWRPQADTVVFYTLRYFVVVKWHSPDRAAVTALVRVLEKSFGEGK